MDYTEAKKIKAELEAALDVASKTLNAIPGVGSGAMGLTPDAVKFSTEYRVAKTAYEKAFKNMRAFNGWFTKTFKKEYLAERRERQKRMEEAGAAFLASQKENGQ